MSITEDAAIQIDLCDSAEFVHFTHTMELLVQHTRTTQTRSFHRVSLLPYHRHPVLGSPVSFRQSFHHMATDHRMVKTATVVARRYLTGTELISTNRL